MNSLHHRPPPGDGPHTEYHAAVTSYMTADAEVQPAEWKGTAEELAAARSRVAWAEADFLIERHRIGRQLAEAVRIAAEDETTAYAVLLALLEVLGPVFEPIADRLAALEGRVENLETLAARRGVGR